MTSVLEGELTDQASCPRSTGSDPQTVISDTAVLSAGPAKPKAAAHFSPNNHVSRQNPFYEDSDTTNTSADVTPVHVATLRNAAPTGGDAENATSELEVIRCSSLGLWFVGSHSNPSASTKHLTGRPVESQLITLLLQNGQTKEVGEETKSERLQRFQ